MSQEKQRSAGRFLCAAAALLVISGCGGSKDDLEADTQAATSAICDEIDLSKPGVCEGPWEYVEKCYANAPSSACGAPIGYEQKACSYTCALPQFGIAGYTVVHTAFKGYLAYGNTGNCLIDKSYNPWKACDPTLLGCTASSQIASQCAAWAQSQRNALVPAYGSDLTFSYTLTSASCGREATYQKCSVTVSDPFYNTRTDPACGTYSCNDPSKPIYPSCRHYSNGLDPNVYACGPEKYTAPNVAAPTGDLAYARCTTADDISDPHAKFTRLKATLDRATLGNYPPAQVDVPALKNLTAAKLELLLELHGEDLDATTDLPFIQGLYGSMPAASPSCGTRLAIPPPGDTSAAAGGIVMCDRLGQPHVRQPAAAASAGACLDVASRLSPSSDSALIDLYLPAALPATTKALEAMPIPVTDSVARQTELQNRLGFVQLWYDATKPLYPFATNAQLWEDASAVAGAAVRGAYSSALDAFCGSPGCSSIDPGSIDASKLQTLVGSSFTADREILAAAFPNTGDAPLRGAPLAFVVANAIEAASARLSAVAPQHDVACLTRQCLENARTTPISQSVALFGRIHDASALASAVTASTQVDSSWKSTFAAISAKHAVLEQALADAEGLSATTPDLATVIRDRIESPPASASLPVITLSKRVLPMKRLADHFDLTRTFVTESASLDAGLDRDRLSVIKAIVEGQISQLTGAVTTYRTGRSDLVQSLVSEIRAERDQQSVRDRLARLNEQTKYLGNDLAALRVGQMADDQRLGMVASEYQRLLQDMTQLTDYRVDPLPFTRTIAASASRYENPTFQVYDDITLLSVGPPIAASAGDVVRLNVSSTWSPSCAVTKIGQIGVADFKYPVAFAGADGAVTGPEGYSVSYSSQSYNAFSTAKVKSKTNSVCLGISAEAGLKLGTPESLGNASLTASASAQTCSSTTRSTTWSNGTEERVSATFAQGLRLPNTPFPDAPAGALLLVRMPVGETVLGSRRDVIVLQSQNSLVVPEASDLYFVVNDLKDPTCSGVAGSLTVEGASLRSVGTQAERLSAAMARAVNSVQSAAAQYVSEGRLLPASVAALRSLATKDLQTDCGCDLSTYPAPIQGFFGLWVDWVLSRAERQVEAANIVRQMIINELELKALADDLQRARHEGALVRLIPMWTLQNVDADKLLARTEALSNTTAEALFPFLRILYPETFDSVASNRYANGTLAAMDAILALDWTKPYDEAADKFAQAVGKLMADLERTTADVPRPSATEVAVAFVRPGAPIDPLWREADPERSAALWRDIGRSLDNPSPPRITTLRILPEDLYSPYGGLSQLTCSQSAPVIRTMGFYVATPSECSGFNANGVNVPVYFDDAFLKVPTGTGLESFLFDDLSGWLNPTVNVVCGKYEFARSDPGFHTGFLASPGYQRTDGAGLSPFDDITIDFRWFDTPPGPDYDILNEYAQALVVWFKVEPRQIPATPTSGGVRGVIGCPNQ